MVRTRSQSRSRSRSGSRSPRERVDKFGRVIPPGKKRSISRSRSRSRDRYRRRTRSPFRRRHYRSRSRSRSRDSKTSRHSRNSRSRSERRSRSPSRSNRDVTSRTNIEDPAFLNARIFIGKLPSDKCSKEELESLFAPYGKILGVSIHDRGFGFVQFENEEDARKAQESENGTKFLGQVLDVKMAAEGRRGPVAPRQALERGAGRGGPGASREYEREPGGYPGRDGRGLPPPPGGRDRSPVRGDPYEDRFRDPYARREPLPRDSVDMPGHAPPRDDPYYADPYRRPLPIDDPYRDPYRDDPYRRDPYRRDPYDDPYRDPYYRDPFLPPPPPPKKSLPADVQIICMNKQLAQYAESIEARLRQHALIIDIIVIPEELTVPNMVEEAARQKFLFAIIINTQNEQHKSLTLNILHGTPQEHRNMPLEDAMKLIASSFEKYIQTQREKAAAPPAALPGATPAPGAPPFLPASADIAYLLNLLADNRQLTIEELGKVIDYLKERREKLMIAEGVRPPAESPGPGRPAPTGVQAPSASAGDSTSAFLQQQQQELQNKILNILNGSGSTVPSASPSAIQTQSLYGVGGAGPTRPQQNQSGSNPLINFDNPNVQKALDNLIQSGPSLLKSLPSTVTQSTSPRSSAYQPNQQSARQPGSYPGQQAQQGNQGAQAGYGGSQYGQFQQQSPMQGQAAPRGPQQGGFGAQQQRGQMGGARTPQQAARPRF